MKPRAQQQLSEELHRVFALNIAGITQQSWDDVIKSSEAIAQFLDNKKIVVDLVFLTNDNGIQFVFQQGKHIICITACSPDGEMIFSGQCPDEVFTKGINSIDDLQTTLDYLC